ncbi:synaptonemal complex central element protein 3 [Corythoichthys intestinalis]|uniref:synaptonemal complex central element protein 3 n=1 Tax=Corythoichthys intestinalis TaxID=161448 RepID=UPI0025A50368|nr:synaptonemal complex central element protein 3 [Corythoichthys intestinalis]
MNMPDTPFPSHPQNGAEDSLEQNEHLERMIDEMENIAVRLTWMAYDMAALRTNPELWGSLQQLKEARHQCSLVILGPTEETRPQ